MGMHAEVIRGRSLPLGKGLTGQVAKSGKPSGLGKEASADLSYLLGPAAEESPLKHALAVPLTTDGGCLGAMTLYRTSEQGFTEDDARLASVVARQTGIAIRNAGQFEKTKQSALTDQLTGLSNARYFFMNLEQELNRAQREQRPMSLIAIDLNGLKRINDSFGHQQGDRALKTIAEVFRRHVRNYDTVVRYAGDEFFILPDTTNQLAVETANRIKKAVRETSLEVLPHQFISLSASFGVATFPGDAKEAEALIAVADRAMYADKRLNQQAALLSAEGRSVGTQQAALSEESPAGRAELHFGKREESLKVPEERPAPGKPRSPRLRTRR
jgi:diguanylate cyclase (GGDEF)-like protein